MAAPALRTGAPLRGLAAFGEADRDVFFGRERDVADVAKMVMADGFRAGLLYGEPGVGKTSLLHAGVIPALTEKGAVVIPCSDPAHPAQAFADAMMTQGKGGIGPHQGEQPFAYVARVIANAPGAAPHIFLIDDVEAALSIPGDRVIAELGELFSRVLSRSGARARVLFVCASAEVHALGALERRTGSLFPPAARHELLRLPVAEAQAVLERTLSYAGVTVDANVIEQVCSGLGRNGGVLPADLQIAALAIRELRIGNATHLMKAGGPGELENAWLHAAARASGHEKTGLRILGELAVLCSPDGSRGLGEIASAGAIADRMGIGEADVARTLASLEDQGIVLRSGADWMLSHPVIGQRIRELTAPARASARRTYELLGSKAAARQRLTLLELYALRTEQIAPTSDTERAVVQRSKRFYLSIVAAVAAVPIIILIILWMMGRGHYYYAVEPGTGGERIMVRDGRKGLTDGSVVADTGLSRSMVDPALWKRVLDHDVGGDVGDWPGGVDGLLRPDLAALVQYAATGDEGAIKKLTDLAKTDDDRRDLLAEIQPIARGTPSEVALVQLALANPSPALQKQAIAVAGAAAQRGADVYKDILIDALVSQNPEQRRIALTAVRDIGGDRARDLFDAALAKDPQPDAKRDLQLEVATAAPDDTPSADNAVATLADPASSDVQREQAKEQLTRAFAADRASGLAAAAKLLGNDSAPDKVRIDAAKFLLDATADTRDDVATLSDAAKAAWNGKGSDELRATALPLYARADPNDATIDLNALGDKKLRTSMRVAIATAWGELARAKPDDAEAALDKMIKDADPDVRSAAAAAYGYLGRSSQDTLTKMVKNERLDVAIGAANGLAATAEVGASLSVAIDGIYQLWKQKGRSRREAATVYGRIARRKPGAVVSYLNSAAHMTDDPGLHVYGVRGLCNAATAGSSEARADLAKVTGDSDLDVRKTAIACVANGKDPGKNGVKIAVLLIGDGDDGIRAQAARVLAQAARGGKVSADVAGSLIERLRDPSRDVRMIAMQALPALGEDAVKAERERKDKKAGDRDPIGAAFEAGDEPEKLALLHATKELGEGELVQTAMSDGSPLVRVAAVDLALATSTRVDATMATALADPDPQVRRAALGRIADGKALAPDAAQRALELGIGDPDPALSQLALTTLARVLDPEAVAQRLGRLLASRNEQDRARAAAAAIGLAERAASKASDLLTPLLDDPSHDVRVAMLPALGTAWSSTNSPEQLANMMKDGEKDAMKRITAAAAFVILARTDAGRSAATAALQTLAKSGPPMAKKEAQLALGLIGSGADGIAFLAQLMP